MRLTAGAIGVAAGEFHTLSGRQEAPAAHSIGERIVANIGKPDRLTFYPYTAPKKLARGIAGIRADLLDRTLTIDQLAKMRCCVMMERYNISRRYAWQVRMQARRGELIADPPRT